MKPYKFNGATVTYAENQPQYIPLPAYSSIDGNVLTCWKFSWMERFKILFGGKLYHQQLTFKQPLQPIKLDIRCKVEIICESVGAGK